VSWLTRRARRRANALLARRLVAYLRGELDAASVFAAQAGWDVPGRSQVAGRFVGRSAIDQHVQRLRDLSDGSLRFGMEGVSDGVEPALFLHVTAVRLGRRLDDHQVVMVRVVDDLVSDARVIPSDAVAFDEFWGGPWRPLLTPDDREVLASAWRAGSARSSSSLSGLLALLLAMGGGVGAIYIYKALTEWRPPVTATISTQNVAGLKHLSLAGRGTAKGSVRWLIDSAYVGRMTVAGPDSGTLGVVLPLDPGSCQTLADKLGGGDCSGSQLRIDSPIGISWSVPQEMSSLDGREVAADSVDIAPFAGSAATVRLALSARMASEPRVCFGSPLNKVTLVVSRGPRSASFAMTGDEADIPCDSGLQLVVGSPGNGQPPALEFDAIDSMTMHARAAAVTMQGLAGQIVLTPGGTTILGTPSQVSMRAESNAPFAATLEIGPGRQSLVLHSNRASSVLTDTGEQLPSEWDRNPGILVPFLGGFVGALVITPLGVAVQGLMSELDKLGQILSHKARRRRLGGGGREG
jgi:hypothetical protein